MASQPIATVVAVIGKAFARNENLELRALKQGDTLLEGETVITSTDGRVELSFLDGSTMEVAADQAILMATDLFESGRPDVAESALADTTTEQILQALAEGRDIDTALEAPAAGVEGGTEGEGNSFVRLLRITEEVDPLTFEFEGTTGTEPPVFEEGLVVEEPEVIMLPVFTLTGDTTVNEGAAASYAITLDGADLVEGQSVTFNIATGLEIDTATEDVDYDSADGTLTVTAPAGGWAIGAQVAGFTVQTIDDTVYDPGETYSVELTGSSIGTAGGTVETTITDNDTPVFTLTGDTTVNEGAAASYAITLDGADLVEGQSVTFNIATGL
ncbi:MAG: retention module-containing protein, partial [Desulfoarculaceae bacterium]|nr:retention module-containing protein [Desulfoarculaceae bacterium]